jgi:glucose-6-phosphate dehydrogenase assembly protein OpcA
MASAVAERLWRASTPATLERDLSELWRDVGRKGPIARAMMSNLVVVRAARIERRAGVSIDAVVAHHPSRVLIIDHEQSGPDACEISGARIGVVTFGPPGARYGVEQIAVRSSCIDESMPSLVRRLVRGDLPISVWWAEDLSSVPLLSSIVDMGRQLVYDSRQWHDVRRGVQALEPWRHLDLVDMNWRRLTPIRRAMVLAARIAESQNWDPGEIRITHRRGDAAKAWLIAGWLASCLRWSADALAAIEETTDENSMLTVTVGSGGDAIVIRSDGRQVVVQHANRPPSIVSIPQEGEADALAAELHSLSHDVRLHDALSALHVRFNAA